MHQRSVFQIDLVPVPSTAPPRAFQRSSSSSWSIGELCIGALDIGKGWMGLEEGLKRVEGGGTR